MSINLAGVWLRPLQRIADQEKRHRVWVLLGGAAAVLLAFILAVHGFDYYTLDLGERPHSPKHVQLRPGGTLGLRLGMLGLFLFVLIYLYPIRKRWGWLGTKGKTTHWLDYHVLLGLTAPVIISFHASFKAQGFAGIAYWTMMVLTFSGIVGRYFYSQVPRSREAAESSLREMEQLTARSLERLGPNGADHVEIRRILHLPSAEEVQAMSLSRAVISMMALDALRFRTIARVRRLGSRKSIQSLGGLLSTREADLETAIAAARKQALLAKKVLFLSKTGRVFHLWHVVHRPFSLSFAILVIMHLAVVLLLGYF
jgi:hypothetical protein